MSQARYIREIVRLRKENKELAKKETLLIILETLAITEQDELTYFGKVFLQSAHKAGMTLPLISEFLNMSPEKLKQHLINLGGNINDSRI